jgi:hypothetical protein
MRNLAGEFASRETNTPAVSGSGIYPGQTAVDLSIEIIADSDRSRPPARSWVPPDRRARQTLQNGRERPLSEIGLFRGAFEIARERTCSHPISLLSAVYQ